MTLEEFVKAAWAGTPLSTLTGTEANLTNPPFKTPPESDNPAVANLGKKTAEGWTTQAAKAVAGFTWNEALAANVTFLVGIKLAVLPGENEQFIVPIFFLEGGGAAEFAMQRTSATTFTGVIEVNEVELATKSGLTWAAGDTWFLVCFEGKFSACRVTSAGAYSVASGLSALGSNAKKGKEPTVLFNPNGKSSTAVRLTSFVGGGPSAAATLPLGSASGSAATSLALHAPTQLPLGAAQGSAATSLALSVPTKATLPLSPAAGSAGASLVLSTKPRLSLAAAGSAETSLTLTVPTERPRILTFERPPMRQYLLATTPSGRVYRWGEDELQAAEVIEGLTDSGSVPGGDREIAGSLPRLPGIDYDDMKVGTRVELFGAGGRLIRQCRLERTPRSSGDYLTMDPAAMGYQVRLTDKEEAREIFLDSELGAWGDPPIERRKQLNEAKVDLAAAQSVIPGAPNEPAGIGFDFANVETNSERVQAGEAWYDAAGIWINKVIYFFRAIGGYDTSDETHWLDRVVVCEDEQLVVAETGENHHQSTNASAVTFTEPYTGRVYVLLESRHLTGVSGNTMNGVHVWQAPKVIGFHGLPLYGSWPEIGILASDVIAYALSQWAPGIRFTTGPYGSLKPSSFLIPHLVFKEPTTVQEMITAALKFEVPEWGVWGTPFGPTFFLNGRGEREGAKRWRTRMRPAKFTETGQQMDQVYNRAVVSFTGPDGRAHTVGPVGSGAEFTDARCEDTDPLNPINVAGEDRTKHISLNDIATPEGGAETAQRFLEGCKLLDGSGEATLTGFVEDEHGAEWPYDAVMEGDLIDFVDSSIPGYRYIVEATHDRETRSANIKIDAPPDSYEALLEQLGVRETAAGVGS
jgi:hypothetical protein